MKPSLFLVKEPCCCLLPDSMPNFTVLYCMRASVLRGIVWPLGRCARGEGGCAPPARPPTEPRAAPATACWAGQRQRCRDLCGAREAKQGLQGQYSGPARQGAKTEASCCRKGLAIGPKNAFWPSELLCRAIAIHTQQQATPVLYLHRAQSAARHDPGAAGPWGEPAREARERQAQAGAGGRATASNGAATGGRSPCLGGCRRRSPTRRLIHRPPPRGAGDLCGERSYLTL